MRSTLHGSLRPRTSVTSSRDWRQQANLCQARGWARVKTTGLLEPQSMKSSRGFAPLDNRTHFMEIDLKDKLVQLETQVAAIKDPTLRRIAFEKLLDKVV